MKNGFYLLTVFVLSFLFSGCDKDSDHSIELLSEKRIVLDAQFVKTGTIRFTSVSSWKISQSEIVSSGAGSESSWLVFDKVKGESGENEVSISVLGNNPGDKSRGATVCIVSGSTVISVLVIQKPGAKYGKMIRKILKSDNDENPVGRNYLEFHYRFEDPYGFRPDSTVSTVKYYDSNNVEYTGGYVDFSFFTLQSHAGDIISFTFNDQGLKPIAELRGYFTTMEPAEGSQFMIHYQYDDAGRMSRLSCAGTSPEEIRLTWEGDKIRSVERDGKFYVFHYDKGELNNMNLDLFFLVFNEFRSWVEPSQLLDRGGIRPQYLPSAIEDKENNRSVNISYEKDDKGYISEIHFTYDNGLIETYKLDYYSREIDN